MSSNFTPASHRPRGAPRTSFNAQPGTPSRLAKSTSTPYQLYSSSPSRIRANAAASVTPIRTSAYHDSSFGSNSLAASAANSSPVFRRNVGFGSPGVRAHLASSRSPYDASASSSPAPASSRLASNVVPSASSPSLASTPPPPPLLRKHLRASRGFVRRKHWTEKFRTAPVDWFHQVQSKLMDFEEYLYDPSFGYPIGFALHVLSLVSHLISPNSPLGLMGSPSSSRPRAFGGGAGVRASSRNASSGRPRAFGASPRSSSIGVSLSIVAIGMSLALFAIACYNAYVLFTSRRSYRLWMRSEKDVVRSANARLVPTYVDDDDQDDDNPGSLAPALRSLVDRAKAAVLQLLRDIPILGWFIPAAEERAPPPVDEIKMHELNVWQAPEVPLRIFTIYSPAHAVFYAFPSLFGATGPVTFLFSLGLMSLFALQMRLLATVYADLVKDRMTLAAEVMHEYDEKFVLPRAMPLVRDASTMTSEAETIKPEDWM